MITELNQIEKWAPFFTFFANICLFRHLVGSIREETGDIKFSAEYTSMESRNKSEEDMNFELLVYNLPESHGGKTMGRDE